FAGDNPLGHQLQWRRSPVPVTIVGVARDVRHWSLRDPALPAVYLPLTQRELGWTPDVLVRTSLPVSSVSDIVRRTIPHVDGHSRVARIATLDRMVDDFLERERLLASLSSLFGAIALVLAGVGIYGVIAYSVTRRVNEIG